MAVWAKVRCPYCGDMLDVGVRASDELLDDGISALVVEFIEPQRLIEQHWCQS